MSRASVDGLIHANMFSSEGLAALATIRNIAKPGDDPYLHRVLEAPWCQGRRSYSVRSCSE